MFVVSETADVQYPNSCAFQLYWEKVKMLDGYSIWDNIAVQFSMSAKEYQGKFYTTISSWKIDWEKTGELSKHADKVTRDDLPFN